ncbi:uncharacterized protein [Amphiura filiformis]|uniref:uncharacterized protein n=1 Tax=Amphiura filiformis TaxID=82378 RepID=UPI003B20F580
MITETWLGEEDPVIINEFTPSGYTCLSHPRPGDRHGGIAIISKTSLKLSLSPVGVDTINFEHVSVTDNSKAIRLIGIYRPPPSKTNGFTHLRFNEEFDDFLSVVSTLPGKPLIMGDLNVHVNKPSKPDVSRYLTSLTEHDLKQYVDKPTHISGNILDHVICRPEDNLLSSCTVLPFRYGSDHHMIQCTINRLKPPPERRVFTSRSYKDLDLISFTSDLGNATQCILSMDDPNAQAELYNRSIREVLDKHCPEKTRSQKLISNPKWYTDDVRNARRERRALERTWRKTRSNEDRDKFVAQNLLPIITSIINNSFRVGSFPLFLRQAVITPLIKKSTLNPDLFKNYRPVSNLPTLGKIIEYPAVSRFNNHLQDNNLTETYQSAYKASHSTETALLRVKNDMLNELDKGKAIMLVLLDLSSAFDTIDHDILVDRMQREFGITGSAKNWFNSYLRDRSNRVCVLGDYSENHPLKYGVPQGSVAGPPIFTAYAQPVANIIRRFQVAYHIYADDTQLYISFNPKSEEDTAAARLSEVEPLPLEDRIGGSSMKESIQDEMGYCTVYRN